MIPVTEVLEMQCQTVAYSLAVTLFVHYVTVVEGNARLVGGDKAPDGLYPYQVSIQISAPTPQTTVVTRVNWLHHCGGAIVTRRNVVTAAHCVIHQMANSLSIWAGTTSLNGNGTRMAVGTYVVHPSYERENTSDIAVVTTLSEFTFEAKRIQPIHYTTQSFGADTEAVMTGWGLTTQRRGARIPNDLQRLFVRTIANTECNRDGVSVDSGSICTLSPSGKGLCGGDAGGPLARGNLLIGVASHGSGNCAIGIPDVYTRISEFAEWITEQTNVALEPQIVGGSTAANGRFPYQVSIQTSTNGQSNWFHWCGGSIVTRRSVVTAAHCVVNKQAYQLSSVVGTNTWNAGGIRYYTNNWVRHPNYVSTRSSDIAVITTQTQIQLIAGRVQAISYSNAFIGGNVNVILTGWGKTNSDRNSQTPTYLQVIGLVTMTNANCQQNNQYVDNTGICTFGQRGRGACGGDSGGPLVTNNGVLVGVNSYGSTVCAIGVPDVFTRISVFFNWLQQNTRN